MLRYFGVFFPLTLCYYDQQKNNALLWVLLRDASSVYMNNLSPLYTIEDDNDQDKRVTLNEKVVFFHSLLHSPFAVIYKKWKIYIFLVVTYKYTHST